MRWIGIRRHHHAYFTPPTLPPPPSLTRISARGFGEPSLTVTRPRLLHCVFRWCVVNRLDDSSLGEKVLIGVRYCSNWKRLIWPRKQVLIRNEFFTNSPYYQFVLLCRNGGWLAPRFFFFELNSSISASVYGRKQYIICFSPRSLWVSVYFHTPNR